MPSGTILVAFFYATSRIRLKGMNYAGKVQREDFIQTIAFHFIRLIMKKSALPVSQKPIIRHIFSSPVIYFL